ncbi:MAG: FIST C-terminal domain-containing protein [Deltaproteobacteria bacterium]|nr:FIST C-terminal domain-containing protein [Deltaproteobacteria bacterium]
MNVATLRYASGAWSAPFPDLDGEQTIVLAFGAPSYGDAPAALAELAQAYPRAAIVGCSTAGEIDQTRIRDESVTVAIARFERTRIQKTQAALTAAADSRRAGGEIAEQLAAAPNLRAVFVLSRGTDVNGSELVRGLNEKLPPEVVVTGGLAGDGARFGKTWVMLDGATTGDAVVAVGLYGDAVRVTHGSQGGWDTFGPERVVTSSKGNVLYELDDRPALALYKEYLGERAAGLPGSALLFPLALRGSHGGLVRTVLGVDEATQSMVFAGDIPTGSYAKLMRANFDRLILGAQAAGSAALSDHAGPTLCIAISCVGRRLVLGERSEEEIEATLEVLPKGTAQVGFYSYGELSPHATGRCDLHNQTMTLTVVSEA